MTKIQVLGRKTGSNDFKQIQIIQSIFSSLWNNIEINKKKNEKLQIDKWQTSK